MAEQEQNPDFKQRSENYVFTSEKALIAFYANHMPEDAVKKAMEEERRGFRPRYGVPRSVTRLQFLKKCEYALNRILHGESASAPAQPA